MPRRRADASPKSKQKYERSYGDADGGGWAPRQRSEDESERSRYSSQRDQQEDRSGFTRGYQGPREVSERHAWGKAHAHGDERLKGRAGKKPLSAAESVAGPEATARRATKLKTTARKPRKTSKSKRQPHPERPVKRRRR